MYQRLAGALPSLSLQISTNLVQAEVRADAVFPSFVSLIGSVGVLLKPFVQFAQAHLLRCPAEECNADELRVRHLPAVIRFGAGGRR